MDPSQGSGRHVQWDCWFVLISSSHGSGFLWSFFFTGISWFMRRGIYSGTLLLRNFLFHMDQDSCDCFIHKDPYHRAYRMLMMSLILLQFPCSHGLGFLWRAISNNCHSCRLDVTWFAWFVFWFCFIYGVWLWRLLKAYRLVYYYSHFFAVVTCLSILLLSW